MPILDEEIILLQILQIIKIWLRIKLTNYFFISCSFCVNSGNTAKIEVHIFRIREILSFNKFEKVVFKFTYVKYVFAAKSKKATE